jgi:hypothetical protein
LTLLTLLTLRGETTGGRAGLLPLRPSGSRGGGALAVLEVYREVAAEYHARRDPMLFEVPHALEALFARWRAVRWVAAVNAEGSYGHWRYVLVKKPSDITAALAEMAGRPGQAAGRA